MNGYLQIPRRLYSHAVMKEPAVLQVFLALLFRARFQEGEVLFRGQAVRLQPGACVLTRRELAAQLEQTPTKVRDALKRLERYGLICCDGGKSHTRVRIVGFGEYQPTVEKVRPQNDHKTTTESPDSSGVADDSRPQNDHKTTTVRKREKNNINNNIYIAEFEKFWERYPKKFNRQQTMKNYIKAAKVHGTEAIARSLDVYLAEIEAKGTAADYLIRSTNFVGQKAYFLGYLEEAEAAELPAEGADSEAEKTRLRLEEMRKEDRG